MTAVSILLFVLAAGAGALIRVFVIETLNRQGFPWGTLAVNSTGALALGVAAGWSEWAAIVFGVAFLGSLTTFSTFAVESEALWAERRYTTTALYILATAGLAIGAAYVGLSI